MLFIFHFKWIRHVQKHPLKRNNQDVKRMGRFNCRASALIHIKGHAVNNSLSTSRRKKTLRVKELRRDKCLSYIIWSQTWISQQHSQAKASTLIREHLFQGATRQACSLPLKGERLEAGEGSVCLSPITGIQFSTSLCFIIV